VNDRITREQMIMQSVTTYVRAALFDDRGYPEDQIDLLDAFPHEEIKSGGEPEKNAIAVGFNFDDQGTPLELGSSLKRRIYTIEQFVFGTSPVWAENLAHAVKFAVDRDESIPLLDISDPALPEIDTLEVLSASAEHQPVPRPRPWERHVWVTTIKVADDYFAALA
jgi:hypothetical protein